MDDVIAIEEPGASVPRRRELKNKLLSKKRLSVKDDLEPYKKACELINSIIQKDWVKYGSLLSEKEVRMGLEEIKNPNITAQQYRTEIIPTEMKQNRGPYQDLIDYELLSENIINEDEVQFVFRYTYKYQGQLIEDDETIWVVREHADITQENIYDEDEIHNDYQWRISFHGSYGNALISCLQMGWLKRIVSACAVVPSYNDAT